MRVVGATVGQLLSAPIKVAEAALGIRSGGRGMHGRGGYGGVNITGGRSAVRHKVARQMKNHAGNQRSGRSVHAAARMPTNTGGFVKVSTYKKHTRTGRVIEVRGYQRPKKKR
jgi:hypothetical protein